MFGAAHRGQESGDFLRARDNGEFLRLPAGWDVVFDNPRLFEGDGIDKPECGHGDRNRTGRQSSLLDQVNLPRPDLVLAQQFGRPAEMAGEPGNLLDVSPLCVRREVTDPHILNHAAAKRGHWQLLCETNSATWRHLIVSRLSWPARGNLGCLSPTHPAKSKPWPKSRLPRSGLVVCLACSIAWGCKSPSQPDGGEGLAKRKGISARRCLKEARSKTAT